jgi:tetratricopeptide (TPR) repeat protein
VVAAFRARLAGAGPGPIVQVIDGMAGVGKTTLAVHLAGLSADRYPDGHLFIDLHGHSAHDAVDPSTALLTLLRQLDVAPERIPAAIEERVALWRSEVARRRCVLVLDNAATTAQVLPLLPGSGENVTLVTSRRRLSGLDGVRPESLPVLHSDEGADLFGRIVGDRARTEPEAVAEVVRRCGYLPLAIRLAAARLSSRPSWQVADLVTRLGDATLAQLVAEDRTVAAAFALSYAQLPAESQRVFRLLGIHPAEGFDAASAAALADLTLDEADRILESLVDVHLVEATGRGAYRLHDLIRQYAGLLAADPEQTRAAAYRLFDHTVHSAAVVSAPLELPTSLLNRRFAEPWRADLLPDPGTDPIRWFDGRRHAHLAILRLAGHLGADSYVWLLARSAWRLWYLRAEYDELIDAHRRGLAAARSAGDDYATAMMLNYLASGLYRVGRLPEAVEMTAAAFEAFARLGDRRSAVVVLANLGLLRVAYGDLEGAVQAAGHILDWAARLGVAAMNEQSLTIMGEVERRRGNLEASLRWYRHHMLSAMRGSGAVTRYLALNNVAVARMRLGHPAARRLLRLSIALNARIGAQSVLAESATALAVLERREGRLDDAIRRHRSAVELAGTNPDVRLRAAVRNDYAETLQVAGDRTAAAALFREAASLAQAAGALWEQIRSLDGLATVLDDPEAAAGHRKQAAALLRNSPAGPMLLRPLDDRS